MFVAFSPLSKYVHKSKLTFILVNHPLQWNICTHKLRTYLCTMLRKSMLILCSWERKTMLYNKRSCRHCYLDTQREWIASWLYMLRSFCFWPFPLPLQSRFTLTDKSGIGFDFFPSLYMTFLKPSWLILLGVSVCYSSRVPTNEITGDP